MCINDIEYHLFEQGLCQDLSKPALSVCIAYPLFGSLVWAVLPSQARSTDGRANIKPHKRLVTSLLGAVVCTLQAYLTTTSMILSSRGCIQKSLSHLLVCCQLVLLSPGTSSTRSMQTRDAGVCSCLTQGACARVCSTCHSGSPDH